MTLRYKSFTVLLYLVYYCIPFYIKISLFLRMQHSENINVYSFSSLNWHHLSAGDEMNLFLTRSSLSPSCSRLPPAHQFPTVTRPVHASLLCLFHYLLSGALRICSDDTQNRSIKFTVNGCQALLLFLVFFPVYKLESVGGGVVTQWGTVSQITILMWTLILITVYT